MKKKWSGPTTNRDWASSLFKTSQTDRKVEKLLVRFSKPTKRKIENMANKNGVSQAKIVRKLLKRELKKLGGQK